jgi:DNA-binding IclR family transcriptional regulator
MMVSSKAPARRRRNTKDETEFESAIPRRGQIRIVSRVALIIRLLARHPRGLTLGEISKESSLPKSTVQRLVDALDYERFVIAVSPEGGVRLGPGLVGIVRRLKSGTLEFARPAMLDLARETGETVDLCILDYDKIVFVDQVPGTHRLQAASAVGVAFPLHSSSAGKVMMAALSEAQLKQLRRRIQFTKVTDFTLRNWQQLQREIEDARKTGVAFDREETTLGLTSVSAALRLPGGNLAAIAIPAPTARFLSRERFLTERLIACCRALQQKIDAVYSGAD